MKWQSLLLAFTLIVCNVVAFADVENPLVTIKKFKFIPQEITIKRGQTVRWENHEKRQFHNVWFEAAGDEEPDYIFPEEFYEREFTQIGSFPYLCGPHREMTGVVHVVKLM